MARWWLPSEGVGAGGPSGAAPVWGRGPAGVPCQDLDYLLREWGYGSRGRGSGTFRWESRELGKGPSKPGAKGRWVSQYREGWEGLADSGTSHSLLAFSGAKIYHHGVFRVFLNSPYLPESRAFQKNSAVIHPRNVTTRAYWLLSLEMKSQGTWIRNPLTNIVTKLSPPTVHLRSHCLSLKVICFPMCAFLPPPRPLLRWYLSPRLSFFFL